MTGSCKHDIDYHPCLTCWYYGYAIPLCRHCEWFLMQVPSVRQYQGTVSKVSVREAPNGDTNACSECSGAAYVGFGEGAYACPGCNGVRSLKERGK